MNILRRSKKKLSTRAKIFWLLGSTVVVVGATIGTAVGSKVITANRISVVKDLASIMQRQFRFFIGPPDTTSDLVYAQSISVHVSRDSSLTASNTNINSVSSIALDNFVINLKQVTIQRTLEINDGQLVIVGLSRIDDTNTARASLAVRIGSFQENIVGNFPLTIFDSNQERTNVFQFGSSN